MNKRTRWLLFCFAGIVVGMVAGLLFGVGF